MVIEMANGRLFDCKVCLNKNFNGKCKSLLYPPAGNTCGWFQPPPEKHADDLQIRELTTAIATSLQQELSDVFPSLSATDWVGIIGRTPSIRRASGASLRRRIRGVTLDQMTVTCVGCGMEMDMDEFVSQVRGGRTTRCPRCSGEDISPGI